MRLQKDLGVIVDSHAIRTFVKTVSFAADKHRAQRRKDAEASPYINHPIGLAHVLAFEGDVADLDVLCAAILHDTVEDTETTFAELEREFGSKIAGIVREVTDDKSLEKHIRKQLQIEHAPHLSREGKLVKLADKICNLRDILHSPPAGWSAQRKREYFAWAEAVVSGLRGTNAKLEHAFDQELLRRNEFEEEATTATVLSIDLAFKKYSDIGVAILRRVGQSIAVELVKIPLTGKPDPNHMAEYFASFATSIGARLMLIDGPQGWKDPNNGLEHSRVCERALLTPAKTGLPGNVKPAGYEPFVSFSIAVYDALDRLGWSRLASPARPSGPTAIESFPLSAWRSLGLPILPAKSKATSDRIDSQLTLLKQHFLLALSDRPNHDELQAIVAGIAGIFMEEGKLSLVSFSGRSPFLEDTLAREGFIVNPILPPAE